MKKLNQELLNCNREFINVLSYVYTHVEMEWDIDIGMLAVKMEAVDERIDKIEARMQGMKE